MKVEFLEDVELYMFELVEILFNEEYFGFKESAYEYVDDIIDVIVSDIHILPKKNAPAYFDKYGKNMQYISYKRSKQTQWYIFFQYSNDTYFIRYIGNNHTIGKYL